VAVAQYTFTNKQYTEYIERDIHNNKKNWEVRAVPRLCELYPGICLTTEEKVRGNSVTVFENCPDMPVAVLSEDVAWFNAAVDCDRWQAVVNAVMNLRVP
jgi:hypothetical protein